MDQIAQALRDSIARVCTLTNLTPYRVGVSFDVFEGCDGGPAFTVTCTVPPADKRQKRDSTVRGVGATLAEAEAELATKWRAHLAYEEQEAEHRKRKK